MARAAELGGAGAVRVSGTRNIEAARKTVSVPIVGLVKRRTPDSPVYITPSVVDATSVRDAGADLVAIDATARLRPDGLSAIEFIVTLKSLGLVVVADIDVLPAALAAAEAGADLLATTLAGYTAGRRVTRPDVRLIARVSSATDCPVIAEGRYRSPSDVRAAFRSGAHAVVVGDAITNPIGITERLVAATPRVADSSERTGA